MRPESLSWVFVQEHQKFFEMDASHLTIHRFEQLAEILTKGRCVVPRLINARIYLSILSRRFGGLCAGHQRKTYATALKPIAEGLGVFEGILDTHMALLTILIDVFLHGLARTAALLRF